MSWDPVAPADLAASAPILDPDAPAEVIFRRISIDDSDFPHQRRVHEYIRYKIFDPARAARLTRISQVSYTAGGFDRQTDIAIAALLTNPDGSTRIFGRKDVQERFLQHEAGQNWVDRLFGSSSGETKESFLAVSGLAKGAVLDIQAGHSENIPGQDYSVVLQIEDVPQRRLELTYRESKDHDWFANEFALNGPTYHAAIHHDDHRHSLTVAADNLPPLYREIFSGPPTENALTFVVDSKPVHAAIRTKNSSIGRIDIDYKANPWGGYASELYILDQDRTSQTKRVKALAAQLAAGPGREHDTAIAIHRCVASLFQRFLHRSPTNSVSSVENSPDTPDQVLDFQKYPNVYFTVVDFVYLETALFRAEGWDASVVALPDLGRYPFDRRLISEVFLPSLGIRVHFGGDWYYACPLTTVAGPFGAVPWSSEGEVALAEGRGTQQFLPVPTAPASASGIVNEAEFRLDADGGLSGTATRRYFGQVAMGMRIQLSSRDEEKQRAYVGAVLGAELKPAEIKVERISGLDDGEASLVVSYSVNWPDYATRTESRLIFHPSAFRVNSKSPFPDLTRHYAFYFPYAWNEQDHVIWSLPEGYQFENPRVPPSSPGDILSYKVSMAREIPSGKIEFRREFSSSLKRSRAEAIGPLKAWYDRIVARDQFELALRRTAPATKADDPAAP